jgi:hypothetical protein
MKLASIRVFALAAVAALAWAAPAGAVAILQFGQSNPNDFVTATAGATSTTFTTSSTAAAGSIPVLLTNVGGSPLGTPIPAFETFIGVTSVGPAISSAGTIEQLYSGAIAITSGPNGTGGNFLTAAFQNASLFGQAGGGAVSLLGSRPPQSVTFTSNFAAIVPLIAGNPPENFTIGFSISNLTPGLSLSGTTVAGFTAANAGTFATAQIPEPSAIAAGAMLAALGCRGSRRRWCSQ